MCFLCFLAFTFIQRLPAPCRVHEICLQQPRAQGALEADGRADDLVGEPGFLVVRKQFTFMFTWDDNSHLQLLLLKSVHCCTWHDVCGFWPIWRRHSSKASCSCLRHSFLCRAESLAKTANSPLQFGPAKRLNLSHPTQQGVVAVGLHGLARRDQRLWALHIPLRIHVQPSPALAACVFPSTGRHRYLWGSVVNRVKDLIWVYDSLGWRKESFNPRLFPCLFHLCDVPVCWQRRRWHRAGNMPWEEPASSSSSVQLGHLKWLRNCGLLSGCVKPEKPVPQHYQHVLFVGTDTA